ncbi:hypothetical protein GcM1_242150 [Golovinomyces cichoracearum]|uniref:Uncharacterized protein n=1 Tax=Golovinomyces cichoracearum TaxID=62708 RepID=A0A420IHE1_9PEZI|nr:hypothetical protein GcM1_242150 [Golovinomyces cichoracearum]
MGQTEFNLEEKSYQSMISRCLAKNKKFKWKDSSELHQQLASSVKHEQIEEALLYWILQCQVNPNLHILDYFLK